MSVLSINAIAGGVTQPSGFAPTPLGSPRQTPSEVNLPIIEPKQFNPEEIQQAVDDANEVFKQIRSDVRFIVDNESKQVVIKLVEPSSGQVLNQYPSEQAVAVSKAIAQAQIQAAERHAAFKSADSGLTGLLVKQKT